MMCLILSTFVRGRARLDYLHLLSWALETDGTRELFKTWLSGARSMDRATVRIDPELKVTVTLARGLSLVDIAASKKVALTDLGKAFVAEINGHEGLLATEKAYLRSLGSLNEARLVRTLGAQAK
jgi:hypothetical protein